MAFSAPGLRNGFTKDSIGRKQVSVLKNYRYVWSVIILVYMMVAGCALVKPSRGVDEVTPIDWGLENRFEGSITVYPFDAQDEKWGVYAAQRMKEYLLENKAFRRVVYAAKDSAATSYELRGELEYLLYGGTHSPSRVCITVRIIDTADKDTRFLRIARASSENTAFHTSWLQRVYVSSPYPEQLLNALLEHVAADIAKRTSLPAKKCP